MDVNTEEYIRLHQALQYSLYIKESIHKALLSTPIDQLPPSVLPTPILYAILLNFEAAMSILSTVYFTDTNKPLTFTEYLH